MTSISSSAIASVNSASVSSLGSAFAGMDGVKSAKVVYSPFSDAGILAVSLETRPDVAASATNVAVKCLRDLAETKLSKEMLIRGQRLVAASLASKADAGFATS